MINIRDKFFGGILGSALGDGIGELAFSRKINRSIEKFEQALQEHPQFIYTDDTAMALGIIESLVANNGKVVEQHLGNTFSKNYTEEPFRGYASGPPTIFRQVQQTGKGYQEVAQTLFAGSGSLGNGSAMRIAPVGVFFYDHDDLYEIVRSTCVVTHTHPIAIDSSAVLAYTIRQAMQLDPAENFPKDLFLQNLVSFCRLPEIRQKMEIIQKSISENWTPRQVALKLKLSVAAHESVPFAIYSFLQFPHSFSECLYCSCLNGGDRDTMGAMATAISGAYLGLSAIPELWVQKLENREKLEGLAEKLFSLLPK